MKKIHLIQKLGIVSIILERPSIQLGLTGSMVYFVAVGMSPPGQASRDMLDSIQSQQLYICNVTASLLIIIMNCQ